ncbi:MAG: hypothetical protein HY554_14340, partial [Elusimicrobia bacterium]|nr:hypothetical protein [Elusimicrobiota bacterium]
MTRPLRAPERDRLRAAVGAAVVLAVIGGASRVLVGNGGGPPDGMTGAVGESTCQSCHSSASVT